MALLLLLLALLLGLGGLAGLPRGSTDHGSARPLASTVEAAIPSWARREAFGSNKQALAGAKLFADSGCTNCHTYLGSGSSNLGAPDLSAEGAKRRGVAFQVAHLRCPSCVHPGSPMPTFGALGRKNLRALAVFLEASRGAR